MSTQRLEAIKDLQKDFQSCPTEYETVSPQLLEASWNTLRNERVAGHCRPSMAIMAALLLTQYEFQHLVSEDDFSTLERIAADAATKYMALIKRNNPVGRKLIAIIKEAQQT